jgi:hypothetical protein
VDGTGESEERGKGEKGKRKKKKEKRKKEKRGDEQKKKENDSVGMGREPQTDKENESTKVFA